MKIITYSTNEDVISGLVEAGQLREGATDKTLFSALLVIPALANVKATSKTGKKMIAQEVERLRLAYIGARSALGQPAYFWTVEA